MRKITEKVMQSFLDHDSFKLDNTETHNGKVWLHGNLIAERTPDEEYRLTMAGWATRTTVERLNGLLELLGSPHFFRYSEGGKLCSRENMKGMNINSDDWITFDKWGNLKLSRVVDFNALS